MNKTMQRIILITAILISGITFALQKWLPEHNQILENNLVPTGLKLDHPALKDALIKSNLYWTLSLRFNEDDPITDFQDILMSGLGEAQSKVGAVQLDFSKPSPDFTFEYHAPYPNILRITVPQQERQNILKGLRICWQNQGHCLETATSSKLSNFIYLLDDQNLWVRYYGDKNWGVISLVEDIRRHVIKSKSKSK